MADEISDRALNRATLARQLLLERATRGVAEAVAAVGPLQAQEPRPPFVALWSRIAGFEREALAAALAERRVVRAVWMRATLHLTTAEDLLALRTAIQPALAAAAAGIAKQRDTTAAPADVAARGAAAARGRAARPGRARRRPRRRVPGRRGARAELHRADAPPARRRADGRRVVLRPLEPVRRRRALARRAGRRRAGAGGPRPPLPRRLRARERRGPQDVRRARRRAGGAGGDGGRARRAAVAGGGRSTTCPDAPRPGEDVPAPPRLLAPFDSVLLAHQDRSRLVAAEHRPALDLEEPADPGDVPGRRRWSPGSGRSSAARSSLAPFGRLAAADRRALEAEARRARGVRGGTNVNTGWVGRRIDRRVATFGVTTPPTCMLTATLTRRMVCASTSQ